MKAKRLGGRDMTQVIEYLPSKCEALSSTQYCQNRKEGRKIPGADGSCPLASFLQ
jgi:hypothetical protein